MLVLFDIDATLISTSGVGIHAMTDAAKEVLGPRATGEGVEYAGRLDPLIMADFCRGAGVEPTPDVMGRFRERYGTNLGRLLSLQTTVKTALPGVMDLVAALERLAGVTLGLLTGNFEETGSMKLRACGVEPGRFAVHVWGDHSPKRPPSRDDLPPLALDRYRSMVGRSVSPGAATIIGDTPHDVRCARVNGCRSVGVATGRYGVSELTEAGADLVVQNLSDTAAITAFLTQQR